MRPTLLVLAVLASSPALAQRVAFPEFTGPGAATVRAQLLNEVCVTADCVPWDRVTTAGKPDLQKARRERVQAFVTGTVARRGKALELGVLPVAVGTTARPRRSWPLTRGVLSKKNLEAAVDYLAAGIARSPVPEPAAPPAPVVVAPPAPTPGPGLQEPVDPPTPAPAPEPVVAPKGPKVKRPFLAIELGVDVVNKRFDFDQVSTSNLRRYELQVFALPVVRLEVTPLGPFRDDFLAGLGIEAAFAYAPWLGSQVGPAPAVRYPTSILRFDGGLRWRLQPLASYALAFTPFVGVRLHTFTVDKAATGEVLTGLPNLAFFGLRAGLGLEVPIVPNLLTVIGRFAVIPVFSAGQIISRDGPYFKDGSTLGLEGSGGLALQLAPFLQVRATFEYLQYTLTFKTQPTDTYVAAGAVDRYLGGNASVRLQF